MIGLLMDAMRKIASRRIVIFCVYIHHTKRLEIHSLAITGQKHDRTRNAVLVNMMLDHQAKKMGTQTYFDSSIQIREGMMP
jgi:N-acetylglutamate synthase-like GNAT family acetyltransferase